MENCISAPGRSSSNTRALTSRLLDLSLAVGSSWGCLRILRWKRFISWHRLGRVKVSSRLSSRRGLTIYRYSMVDLGNIGEGGCRCFQETEILPGIAFNQALSTLKEEEQLAIIKNKQLLLPPSSQAASDLPQAHQPLHNLKSPHVLTQID